MLARRCPPAFGVMGVRGSSLRCGGLLKGAIWNIQRGQSARCWLTCFVRKGRPKRKHAAPAARQGRIKMLLKAQPHPHPVLLPAIVVRQMADNLKTVMPVPAQQRRVCGVRLKADARSPERPRPQDGVFQQQLAVTPSPRRNRNSDGINPQRLRKQSQYRSRNDSRSDRDDGRGSNGHRRNSRIGNNSRSTDNRRCGGGC